MASDSQHCHTTYMLTTLLMSLHSTNKLLLTRYKVNWSLPCYILVGTWSNEYGWNADHCGCIILYICTLIFTLLLSVSSVTLNLISQHQNWVTLTFALQLWDTWSNLLLTLIFHSLLRLFVHFNISLFVQTDMPAVMDTTAQKKLANLPQTSIRHKLDSQCFFISTVLFVAASHLLIRLRNKTGDAAVSFQKLLKLLVTDDEPLRLSEGFLSCILPINQQTLEHLNTGSTDGIRWASGYRRTGKRTHSPSLPLPSSGLGQARWSSPTCLRPRWMCWWPSWSWMPLCTAGTSGESCKGCPGGSSCPELCQSAGWLLHQNCHKRSPKCPDSHLMERETAHNIFIGAKWRHFLWTRVNLCHKVGTNLQSYRISGTIFLWSCFHCWWCWHSGAGGPVCRTELISPEILLYRARKAPLRRSWSFPCLAE